jgi:hypothetical protein
MPVKLHCGEFYPTLESVCAETLLREASGRKDPLREQILVVVPTRLLRSRLLQSLATRNAGNLYGVHFMSINHLTLKILMDTLDEPTGLIQDPVFFPFALVGIAERNGMKAFASFRVCQALYQTIRDLVDGAVSPELLEEAIAFARGDPEFSHILDFVELQSLAAIYRRYIHYLESNHIRNLQTSAAYAAANAESWVRRKNIRSAIFYGFYDSTQSQFDVLESILRTVQDADGNGHVFFPFTISDSNTVAHPAEYAQTFFDRLYSLNAALSGEVVRCPAPVRQGGQDGPQNASSGVENRLFTSEPAALKNHRIEFLSAAGAYEEAWATAKRILSLVRDHDAKFDQIMVVVRSLDDKRPLAHLFAENGIPCNLKRDDSLAHQPFARFAFLVTRARENRLNNATLFELLSSPFLSGPRHRDFVNLQVLLDTLLIRNWDDWPRLEALWKKEELPAIFDSPAKESLDLESLRETAQYLQKLKEILKAIPERDSFPQFADALLGVLATLCPGRKDAAADSLFSLLRKIADNSLLQFPELSLPLFAEVLSVCIKGAAFEEAGDAGPGVLVGDVMQLRGMTADYVFVLNLNRDVFPRRVSEDPFLPDHARRILRVLTGAGPEPKRSRLIPLKEGTEEELLLFALALRSARKKLYLSYQRADSEGRKQSASTYLEEVLRMVTGKTLEDNPAVQAIPKQHSSKFQGNDILPTLAECSSLPRNYDPSELLLHSYQMPGEYFGQLKTFASQINSRDHVTAELVDGCIQDSRPLWASFLSARDATEIRVRYSHFKNYLSCPFQFFSSVVLGLRESPRESGAEEHDMNPLLKGILSESIVKGTIRHLKQDSMPVPAAIRKAAQGVRRKYGDVFPRMILEMYIDRFVLAATNLLEYLQEEDYRLELSETPEYENKESLELIPAGESPGGASLVLTGIPDLITYKARKRSGLISDLKWGTAGVAGTPSEIFKTAEAQFCLYPAMVEKRIGELLPFRYFRLNVFEELGTPTRVANGLKKIGLKGDSAKLVLRNFGGESLPRSAGKRDAASQEHWLDECKRLAVQLLSGEFRIIKDPMGPFSACGRCSYTQVCRRSHAATLLRTKTVERN